MTQEFWPDIYRSFIPFLPEYVHEARLTLCGLASCVDAYLKLAKAEALINAAEGTEPAALAKELLRRAQAGIGGEYRFDWPDAEAWIQQHLPITAWATGGTGVQAAQMLTLLGAPALISLEDRGKRQLSVLSPEVLVADPNGLRKCGDLIGTNQQKPAHYIFEVTAGEKIGSVTAKRSTRVIVRCADDRLDADDDFVRESINLAGSAGAAILCGFNEVPAELLEESLSTSMAIVQAWRARGLRLVHLELGGYHTNEARDKVLARLGPSVTSLGMSHSEICGLGSADVTETALELCHLFDLARVCVHADQWAFSVTQADPELELEALLCGCLFAACRAEHGQIIRPKQPPADAVYEDPPWPIIQQRANSAIVCCPSPYLSHPAATIGLGDTFLAGTLLVLGGAYSSAQTTLFSKSKTES
jgi:ADP-dependent phosphofructokinase/glucokinase